MVGLCCLCRIGCVALVLSVCVAEEEREEEAQESLRFYGPTVGKASLVKRFFGIGPENEGDITSVEYARP